MKNTKILSGYFDLINILSFTTFAHRVKLLQIIILSFIGSIFELTSVAVLFPLLTTFLGSEFDNQPKFLIYFVNLINFYNSDNVALKITLIFSITAILGSLFRVISLYYSGRITAKIGVYISDKAYNSALNKPYDFFLKQGTTKLVSTFTTKPGQVSVSLYSLLIIISSSFLLFSILTTLLLINFQITINTFIALFICYWFINLLCNKRLKSNSYEMCRNTDLALKSAQQSFDSIREIIIDNSQEFFRFDFNRFTESVRMKYAESSFYGSAPKIIIEPIAVVTIITILILESNLNNIPLVKIIPTFGSIIFGLQKILPLMQLIYANYTALISNFEFVKDIVSLIDEDVKKDIIHKPYPFNSQICFKNIYFKYNSSRDNVLENLNLKILKGQRIGLIGESGSGKSTLLDLLVGLLSPTSGEIYADDLLINDKRLIKKYSWKNNISNVSQDVILQDISIAENVALGVPKNEIQLGLVKKCLEIVQLKSFIKSLPDGIWTLSGERGILFSGGQCQRIGIARALYKRKNILILDEATNRLDLETESNLIDSIFDNTDQTIIIVSHRLKSLKKCDDIYELKDKKLNHLMN